MSLKEFRCKKCGFVPRNIPVFGKWYCPKCGKSTIIPQNRPRVAPKPQSKSRTVSKSRDQVINTIFHKFASNKGPDLGYKDPYLNPSIPMIEPEKKNKIRLFFKKNSSD